MGCGESIKEFLALGFRGFGFCDLKRPHKPRLQNRCGLGVFRVYWQQQKPNGTYLILRF